MLPHRSLLLALVILSGCAQNEFRDSYRSSLDRWPSGEVSRLAPRGGNVEIVASNDIDGDATRMMEHGYLMLGSSKFDAGRLDTNAARAEAKELGASVVLVKSKYAKSVVEAVPIEKWIPIRGDRAPAQHIADLQGEFRTVWLHERVQHYDLAATFWARSRPPILGVLVEGTGSKTTQATAQGDAVSARGVVVRAVIDASPALAAGIRRGDVIVRLAGIDITGADQFFDTVVANKGREVDVDVVRAERLELETIHVHLRNEQ